MEYREFLETFVTVEELKSLLYLFGQPRSGPKDTLLSRIVEVAHSPEEVLVMLNNETLQSALRWGGLSPSGRKSELVVRLIENKVVNLGQEDVVSFLESLDEEDFEAYHRLLLCAGAATPVERITRLLDRASGEQLPIFAEAIRSSGDPGMAATALVSMLSRGSGDAPCFAALLLEDMIEASGTVALVASAMETATDEIMAHQRRIQKSFTRHHELVHPAVDSLLQKSWSGGFAQESALLKGVRKEVRMEGRKLKSAVQSLRDLTQAETLHDVSRRTAQIDSKTEDIRRGVQTLQNRLVAIQRAVQKHVEESPDDVARALENLAKAKEVKWRTRRKIKGDLQRFWVLTDRLQKVQFLGQVVATYGPTVLSALRGLL